MEVIRWVSYIYRYREECGQDITENGRLENAGFVKVQQLTYPVGKTARIQIGLRICKPYDTDCNIYLVKQADETEEKPVLLTSIHIPAYEKDVSVKKLEEGWNNICGTGCSIMDFDGILFVLDDCERLLSLWGDREIKPYSYQLTEEPQAAACLEEECEEITSDRMDWKELLHVREKIPEINLFTKHRDMSNMYSLRDSIRINGVKISQADIGLLPIANWKLGVNSFLSHGYYRYRYLLLGKMSNSKREQYIIGVPGNDSRKERYMANMFGFKRFVIAEKESEKNNNLGRFGYWLVPIHCDSECI